MTLEGIQLRYDDEDGSQSWLMILGWYLKVQFYKLIDSYKVRGHLVINWFINPFNYSNMYHKP